jgi:hypothetical protein
LIVAAAADEKLFALFEYADDAEFLRADLDRLSDRRTELEEIVGDFRADDTDFLVRVVFSFGEETAVGDDLRSGLFKIRQRALKRNLC